MLAVLTGADLRRRGLGTLRAADPAPQESNGAPAFVCPQPLLAQDRVRYVGDPVAFVVAETLNQAKDAAELIEVEYEPLPAVDHRPRRRSRPARRRCGTTIPATRPSFTRPATRRRSRPPSPAPTASSAHTIAINRVTANSMEPRGCLAEYDRDEDRYTIRCTVQSVHQIRAALAEQIFRVPHHQVRVVCDKMGGGFGMKGGCYPEYASVAVGVGGHRAVRCAGSPSAARGC